MKAEPMIELEIDATPHPVDLLDDGDSVALRFQRPVGDAIVTKKLGAMQFGL